MTVLRKVYLVLLLHTFGKFAPTRVNGAMLFTYLASVAFASVVCFFGVALNGMKDFLVLMFVIIRLTKSTKACPIRISPSFITGVRTCIPFACAISTFHTAVDNNQDVAASVVMVITLLIVFAVLAVLRFGRVAGEGGTRGIILFS